MLVLLVFKSHQITECLTCLTSGSEVYDNCVNTWNKYYPLVTNTSVQLMNCNKNNSKLVSRKQYFKGMYVSFPEFPLWVNYSTCILSIHLPSKLVFFWQWNCQKQIIVAFKFYIISIIWNHKINRNTKIEMITVYSLYTLILICSSRLTGYFKFHIFFS